MFKLSHLLHVQTQKILSEKSCQSVSTIHKHMHFTEIFTGLHGEAIETKGKMKKNLCFGVNLPYLNLLVKSRIFFRFSGKYIILQVKCFQNAYNFNFSPEKIIKKLYAYPT